MLGLMTVAAHREAMAAKDADLLASQRETRRVGAALSEMLRERDEARRHDRLTGDALSICQRERDELRATVAALSAAANNRVVIPSRGADGRFVARGAA